ncbi:leucine-rich PPR motif-containing protein, mitochondrial isoform X3 [Alligator mississippiensis]|uniref:leucine-rich PPR motif-containing protein, mitochondrial isoform X3 n=1 Tax=Alligator mississippiensis TaxID=8496 RepID=UPI0028780B32|nr:leucine-rich PPR motif-containing protein, mitochondrial isoform X3 [Alligator mississippiensis]
MTPLSYHHYYYDLKRPGRSQQGGSSSSPPPATWFFPSPAPSTVVRPSPVTCPFLSAACARGVTVMAALLRSVRWFGAAWPLVRPAPRLPASRHLIYQARFFTVAHQQEGKFQEGIFSDEFQQRFNPGFEKLNTAISLTGQIRRGLLLWVFHDTCRKGLANKNLILLLLQSCGSLLPELQAPERTELAHRMWEGLQRLGTKYDVDHYNALLQVYLQNKYIFSPADFLTRMERANVQPSQVTYERLIAAYCNEGDIEGASKILEFMKKKEFPITEEVFSSLVTGHARAGDMEKAENILSVLRDAGAEPSPNIYLALLNAYAEKGDIINIEKLLKQFEKVDRCPVGKHVLQVILSLARTGYSQYIQNIIKHLDTRCFPDVMNLCLNLVTQDLEDVAFQILKSCPKLSSGNEGHYDSFLKHCVVLNKPASKLKQFCAELKEANMHSFPFESTLKSALKNKKPGMAIDLMKTMKEDGLPLRCHYFWPLLVTYQEKKDVKGTVEVLKVMYELGIKPTLHTYTNYVLTHTDVQTLSALLQEAGCTPNNNLLPVAELVHELQFGKLENVLALLSSPNMLPVKISSIQQAFFIAFKQFTDVNLWSKITEVLYKDGRFWPTPPGPSEAVGYFLYNLIGSMSDSEIQAKEECLRQYFHQLKKMNILIPPMICRGIHKLLDSYNVPELIKDVQLEDNRLQYIPNKANHEVSALEKNLEELEAKNQPIKNVLKQLILALCVEQNMQKALEVKSKYKPDMVVDGYAALIYLCCLQDNAEDAMNLKEELSHIDSSFTFPTKTYLALIQVLGKSGRVKDVINILKEMKKKDVPISSVSAQVFARMLSSMALRGEVETVNQLFEMIMNLGLAEPSQNLFNSVVLAHLEKGDMRGALDTTIHLYRKYNFTTGPHKLFCKLIKEENTDILQEGIDFISKEQGEICVLHDLLFAFLELGKYDEAKKIIETPGLRAHNKKLDWFMQRCISKSQVTTMENLVEITQGLVKCDRDEMYYNLLKLYRNSNDWQKASAVWTKLKEESPAELRERTLKLLADMLQTNGQEVFFYLPKHDSIDQPPKSEPRFEDSITMLCHSGNAKEAYDIFREAVKKDMKFKSSTYFTLIKALLSLGYVGETVIVKTFAESHIKSFRLNVTASSDLIRAQVRRDYLKDAIDTLKSALENNVFPDQRSINMLVQALGRKGNVMGIHTVEKMMKTLAGSVDLHPMLFVSNTSIAHIMNNNVDVAVEHLESLFTAGLQNADSLSTINISLVFRSVMKEKGQPALDKLSAMADRLANQFGAYGPVTDLFLEYLRAKRMDDAKFLLERYGAIAEQKERLMAFVANKATEAETIRMLLDMVPDSLEMNTVYSSLLENYAKHGDVSSAKAVYEKLKAEDMDLDEITLKQFTILLKKAGQPVPFTELPEYSTAELKNETSAKTE